MKQKWEYLGDGVYAAWDGYVVELRTNSHTDSTNIIFLEPEVLAALNRFYENAKEEQNNGNH